MSTLPWDAMSTLLWDAMSTLLWDAMSTLLRDDVYFIETFLRNIGKEDIYIYIQ